ncbi:hypothetical protein VNO80_09324 [Phaseolus coccineus]|uniref:Uncharacterized protein n=1 Tax=Phaseolus coccineus TaxID=3886 RepID=A0AAN9N699_PHACN
MVEEKHAEEEKDQTECMSLKEEEEGGNQLLGEDHIQTEKVEFSVNGDTEVISLSEEEEMWLLISLFDASVSIRQVCYEGASLKKSQIE